MSTTLDQLAVNTIRTLSIDGVQKANSGHPGLPLGAAPMAYVLWTRFLRHNPRDPKWPDRDRFAFSAGHGSMLLYSLLYLTGYDLSLDDLKHFRQWGSKTPGHPEYHLVPGAELTTGPLGQGFANGIGLAMAEAHLAATYNRPGHTIVDHRTFGLASDGDLMEGVSYEAASLAGHLRLGKIVYLYDSNQVTLSGSTGLIFSEDVQKRFEAMEWHVQHVQDGNDLDALERAIQAGVDETERPSLVIVHTTLGFGSPHKAGSFQAHGSPLGAEEVEATKRNLGWPTTEPFFVPGRSAAHCSARRRARRAVPAGLAAALRRLRQRVPGPGRAVQTQPGRRAARGLGQRSAESSPRPTPRTARWPPAPPAARSSTPWPKRLPELIGGSADLNPSTDTALKDGGDFESPANLAADRQGAVGEDWGYAGRNIFYGIREHAMGSITNGLVYHGGLRAFSATFLVFSDYMRPPIRLAALSDLPSIFVFTHDSIGLGEDGPTHQPIEHLASLRAIPNMVVFRPADANEVTEGWRVAIERRDGPTILVFSRQTLPIYDRTRFGPASGARKGALRPGRRARRTARADPDRHRAPKSAWPSAARDAARGAGPSSRAWSACHRGSCSARNRRAIATRCCRRRSRRACRSKPPHHSAGSAGLASRATIIGLNRFGASAPIDGHLQAPELHPRIHRPTRVAPCWSVAASD